jgi:hypothetical protein
MLVMMNFFNLNRTYVLQTEQLARTKTHLNERSPGGWMSSLSVDCVIFGLADKKLNILLVKHAKGSNEGKWGLPGGEVRYEESLEQSANRLLGHLTGVNDIYLEQLQAFSAVDRVQSERVITFGFVALVQPKHHHLAINKDTLDTQWVSISEVPELIYDHQHIIHAGVEFLRKKIRYQPIGVNLLPSKFTLGQLQEMYETILMTKLDKPNFRRKMLRMDFLVCCDEFQEKAPHQAAILYRFDEERYQKLCAGGFNFYY